jgi:hypothetical protein
MGTELIRYDLMVERALRDVVRQSLALAAESGLPGDHHFFITFATGFRGVTLPDHLRKKYPSEMTIVLQHQFFGLEVSDDRFAVSLSFNSKTERLVIPFASVTAFADPSVNFALQFHAADQEAEEVELEAADAEETQALDESPPPTDKTGADKTGADKTGNVVTLDRFRKK